MARDAELGTIVFGMGQYGPNTPAVTDLSPLQFICNLPRIKYKYIGTVGDGIKKRMVVKWSIKKDAAYQNRSLVWEGSGYSAVTTGSPSIVRNLFIANTLDTGVIVPRNVATAAKITLIQKVRFYGRKQTPELEDPE